MRKTNTDADTMEAMGEKFIRATERIAGTLVAEYWLDHDLIMVQPDKETLATGVSTQEAVSELRKCFVTMSGELAAAREAGVERIQMPARVAKILHEIHDDPEAVANSFEELCQEAQFIVEESPVVIEEVQRLLRSGVSAEDQKFDDLVESALMKGARACATGVVSYALYYHYNGAPINRISIYGLGDHHIPNPDASCEVREVENSVLDQLSDDRWQILHDPAFEQQNPHVVSELRRLVAEYGNADVDIEEVVRAWYQIHQTLADHVEPIPDRLKEAAREETGRALSANFAGAIGAGAGTNEESMYWLSVFRNIGRFVPWFKTIEEAIRAVQDCQREAHEFVESHSEKVQFVSEWLVHNHVMDANEFTNLMSFVEPNGISPMNAN
jgi:hypothetical protein